MKKLVLIALSVALCFPAAFATADTQLYEQGLAMVSLLAEMARNPLMLSLATASEEIEELLDASPRATMNPHRHRSFN